MGHLFVCGQMKEELQNVTCSRIYCAQWPKLVLLSIGVYQYVLICSHLIHIGH